MKSGKTSSILEGPPPSGNGHLMKTDIASAAGKGILLATDPGAVPVSAPKHPVPPAEKPPEDEVGRPQVSEDRLRNLIDSLDGIVWEGEATRDGGFRFLFVSKRAEQLLGYPVQEWLRDFGFWSDRIHPEDRRRAIDFCSHAINAPGDHQIEYRMIAADGRTVWIRDLVSTITPASSGTRIAGVMFDVTREKAVEERLERAVVERTRQLEESNNHLQDFVYSIAHDLRAPLRSMRAFSTMLLDCHAQGLGPDGRDCARRIVRSAQTMDTLVLDLLAYSRLSREEMKLDAIEVSQAWSVAVAQHEQSIHERDACIETAGDLPAVRAHLATLVQVFANLIGNALKFVAPKVEPRIRLSVEERRGKVRLWVEDNGIGIAPEHQERVFNVFERLHTSGYTGTGIGLSIVRKGVERMGGTVGVESEPGKGSRFWIELPRA